MNLLQESQEFTMKIPVFFVGTMRSLPLTQVIGIGALFTKGQKNNISVKEV
jgi:hypothetical protein